MKKVALFVAIFWAQLVSAQNVYDIYINNVQEEDTIYVCPLYDEVHVHPEPGCTGFRWMYDGQVYFFDILVIDRQNQGLWTYMGCDIWINQFWVFFSSGIAPSEPWSQSVAMKCPDNPLILHGQQNPQPDYTYLWSTGETTPSIAVTELGTYSVTVTDACGHSVSDQIPVQEYPRHDPELPEVSYLCEGGTQQVLNPGIFSSYRWSNGATTPTIAVSQPGHYSVQTVNEYGCPGFAETDVEYLVPPQMEESRPLITLDSIMMSGNNMVVWTPTDGKIANVGIYREMSTNSFQSVGTANYENGYFIDDVSSDTRSYRYKFTSIDTCGNESQLSQSYQTMSAQYMGPGATSWWVEWTPYIIAGIQNVVETYEVWSIDNLADFNMSKIDCEVFYYEDFGYYYANLPHGIQDSLLVVQANIKEQYGGGSIISNLMNNYELLNVDDNVVQKIRIYPNPTSDYINIAGYEGPVRIMNTLGQVVYSCDYYRACINLNLPNGIYFISVGTITQKLVIERWWVLISRAPRLLGVFV